MIDLLVDVDMTVSAAVDDVDSEIDEKIRRKLLIDFIAAFRQTDVASSRSKLRMAAKFNLLVDYYGASFGDTETAYLYLMIYLHTMDIAALTRRKSTVLNITKLEPAIIERLTKNKGNN